MDGFQLMWGWQPALYLFLGGAGAGTFVVSGFLHLKDPRQNARVVCLSSWVAVACLVIGLLLLISELTFPLRGLMMWRSFSNAGSWMTIGAWVLFAAVIVFGVTALWHTVNLKGFSGAEKTTAKSEGIGSLREMSKSEGSQTREESFGAGGSKDAAAVVATGEPWPLRVLTVAGMVLGVCVAAYTGILLASAPGIPLWNTWLLPCLFTVSALDAGVAVLELVYAAVAKREQCSGWVAPFLEKTAVALIVAEAVVLACFVGACFAGVQDASAAHAAASSASALTAGTFAPAFWLGVVGCGLLVPLCAVLLARRNRSLAGASEECEPACRENGAKKHWIVVVGAASTLLGGCVLRFVILMAGMHADGLIDTLTAFLA